MSTKFSNSELEAFLDESLPCERMAAIEDALRHDEKLQKQLTAINGRRDAGVHSLGDIWRQYVRYARGDGQGGMYPERHALRFAVYGGLIAALASRRTWPKLLAVGGAVAYARTPIRRAHARLTTSRDRAIATALVPALLALTDAAKICGYALGLADRLTGRVRPAQ